MKSLRHWALGLALLTMWWGQSFAQATTAAVQDNKNQKVQELIMMRMTQALALNGKQAQQLGDILSKYHEQKGQLRQQMRDLTAQLKTVAVSGNEADIQRLLRQANQTRINLDQLDDQMYSDVRPILNPRQQAQFLVVMDEIKSEIRAIRHQGPGATGPGFPQGGFPPSDGRNPNDFPGAGSPNSYPAGVNAVHYAPY